MKDWPDIIGLPLWAWLFVVPTVWILLAWRFRTSIEPSLAPIWRFLDRVYLLSGRIAAVYMVLILVLIVAQMMTRWIGIAFPGSTNFAGYAMAGASFLGLCYAFTEGAHIRVSVLLNINEHTRYWLNVAAFYIGALVATYFARFAVKTNEMSALLNDRTQGQDQVPEWLLRLVESIGTWPWNWSTVWQGYEPGQVFTPIWLPQIVMSIGTILLALALWDYLTRLVVTGDVSIDGEVLE